MDDIEGANTVLQTVSVLLLFTVVIYHVFYHEVWLMEKGRGEKKLKRKKIFLTEYAEYTAYLQEVVRPNRCKICVVKRGVLGVGNSFY